MTIQSTYEGEGEGGVLISMEHVDARFPLAFMGRRLRHTSVPLALMAETLVKLPEHLVENDLTRAFDEADAWDLCQFKLL